MIIREIDLFKDIDFEVMNEIAGICFEEDYEKDTVLPIPIVTYYPPEAQKPRPRMASGGNRLDFFQNSGYHQSNDIKRNGRCFPDVIAGPAHPTGSLYSAGHVTGNGGNPH